MVLIEPKLGQGKQIAKGYTSEMTVPRLQARAPEALRAEEGPGSHPEP